MKLVLYEVFFNISLTGIQARKEFLQLVVFNDISLRLRKSEWTLILFYKQF